MNTTAAATAAPLVIAFIEDESPAEYSLRLAAAYITTHCPHQSIYDHDYDDTVDGSLLAQDLLQVVADLAAERQRQTMSFEGTIQQAGGSSAEPTTVLITTTRRELQACAAIPFYRKAEIRITPLA